VHSERMRDWHGRFWVRGEVPERRPCPHMNDSREYRSGML
jgi:hypothetical protein